MTEKLNHQQTQAETAVKLSQHLAEVGEADGIQQRVDVYNLVKTYKGVAISNLSNNQQRFITVERIMKDEK